MKKMIFFILLILNLIFFDRVYAAKLSQVECSCVTELQKELETSRKELVSHYSLQLKSYLKINNDPQFLEGTNKEHAIILVHGFIASPFEMKEIATRFNDMGYSVYMPLLYGFGSTGETANLGNLEAWRNQISSSVQILSRCFNKISLGGISLGSALVTDYVLNNPNHNISSLMLFSPYFDVSQSIAKLFAGALKTVGGSINLKTLSSLSNSPDLVEILKNKAFYTNEMPIKALSEIFKLSDELLQNNLAAKLDVPVFVAISEADTTINLDTAIQFPKNHFNKTVIFKIKKELNVPHQITYQKNNPQFSRMNQSMVNFFRLHQ